jgi:hypothetical protein
MELSLLGRIDTDLKSLFIVDPTSVGDDLLDPALREIAAEPARRPSAWWIERLGDQSRDLLHQVLERLVRADILRMENRRYFWVLSRRAYPQNTGREEREAKARLAFVIYGDDVPAPRDTLLLGLAESSGLLSCMLSAEEMRKTANRVARVVSYEEIGRSVWAVASDVRETLAATAGGV